MPIFLFEIFKYNIFSSSVLMQTCPYSMTLDLPLTQSLLKITSKLNVVGGGGGGAGGLFWAGGEISDVKFVVSGFLFLISVFSLLVPGSGFCGFWYLISVF